MKEKNQKNKIPFYAKPLQKVLEKSTNLTLSYLYEYSCKYYNEIRCYEEWLESVRDFMKNFNLEV